MSRRSGLLLLIVVLFAIALPTCLGDIPLPSAVSEINFASPDSNTDVTVVVERDDSLSHPLASAKVNGKRDDSVLRVHRSGNAKVKVDISVDQAVLNRHHGGSTTGGRVSTTGGSGSSTTGHHTNAASQSGVSYFYILLLGLGFFFTSRKSAGLICLVVFVAVMAIPPQAEAHSSKKFTIVITIRLPTGYQIHGHHIPFKLTVHEGGLTLIIVFTTPTSTIVPSLTASPSCTPVAPPQGTCSHGLCDLSSGLPLASNCSSCAQAVCALDAVCCASGGIWDSSCSQAVASVCGAPFLCCA